MKYASKEVKQEDLDSNRIAKTLIKSIRKESIRKHVQEHIFGMSIDRIVEHRIADYTGSQLVCENGFDYVDFSDSKFSRINLHQSSGNVYKEANIGNLRSKIGDLWIIIADQTLNENDPLFLRAFHLPYNIWKNKMGDKNKLRISLGNVKTGIVKKKQWYHAYEITSKVFS